jgi:ATPase subunit of ABC transporter with duplicated ATPase domains
MSPPLSSLGVTRTRRQGTLTATDIGRTYNTVVILDAVSLAVGPRTRLGVVGPNGVGKSTLLRILAGLERPDLGRITRAPASLTVGYVPQETIADGRPGETLRASLARRTGVAAAEAGLDRAARALGGDLTNPSDGDDDEVANRSPDEAYSEALETYLALGGPDLDARAAEVCSRLGLPPEHLNLDVTALSGGQAARAALAAILLSRFDILLLDEPTNDLDFAGLDQLESFVTGLDGGLVIISHDRAFLDRTVTDVLELDEHLRTATQYGGGWAAYLEARAVARRHAEEGHRGYVSERQRLLERAQTQRQWAVEGVIRAKKNPPDNDRAAKGAKINRTEKQAGKLRITEKRIERLSPVDKPWEGWQLHLQFKVAARSGAVVAKLSGAVVERGAFRLGPISVEVGWAERLAIVGPNGSGKSTLVGALTGTLPLADGTQYLGPSVMLGELDQSRRTFLGQGSMLSAFTSASGLLPRESRSLLAKFGLGATAVGRSAESLSPGERTRAVLALLMATGVNCLVLDEPTNHLDVPAIEQLEEALEGYDGTLILITHDRTFLEAVRVTRTLDMADLPSSLSASP